MGGEIVFVRAVRRNVRCSAARFEIHLNEKEQRAVTRVGRRGILHRPHRETTEMTVPLLYGPCWQYQAVW